VMWVRTDRPPADSPVARTEKVNRDLVLMNAQEKTELTCLSIAIDVPSDPSLKGCYAADAQGRGTGLMCKLSCVDGTCLGGY
jgi:hypothetical protein